MKICYHCMYQMDDSAQGICPKCGNSLEEMKVPERYLQPGTILHGHFIIGYPLGAGGFGNTYIGWNIPLSRTVAVKEFYPKRYINRAVDGKTITVSHESMEPHFRRGLKDFLTEARTVASLHDMPGVVAISNFFEENGTGYIVMEHLEGEDVRHMLKRTGGKLEYEKSRWIILEVLYTLAELHKRKILHRDIAPDNVFVTKDGHVKLIDFGAARQAFAVAHQNADIVLKPGYSPVEQYTRNVAQGPYTDLYAVAAMFYKMITGKKPAPANERLKQDTLMPPSQLGFRIPEQAELGMMVCLNLMPEHRLQCAEDFIEALDGQIEKKPQFIQNPEPEIIPEQKWTVRHKALLGVGAACLLFVLAGSIFLAKGLRGRGSDAVTGEVVLLRDMVGITEDEAENYIEILNKDYGWDIAFAEGESVFDLSQDEGKIVEQDVPAGTCLGGKTDSSLENSEDSEAVTSEERESDAESEENSDSSEGKRSEVKIGGSLVRDKAGKVTGTITCKVYTNKKIRYEEIRELSAIQLAKKLDIDTENNDTQFIGNDSDAAAGYNYYDILSLNVDGTLISRETIWNEEGEIEYKKDAISIEYAKAPFFYWEKLPDFTGQNISNQKYPVYEWKAETDKEPVQVGEKELIGTNLVVADYYTIYESSPAGYVVEQTIQPGGLLDTSKGLEEPFLHVIADCKELDGMTGYAAKEALEAWGGNITVEPGGSGDMSQPVLYADFVDSNGNEIKEFKLEEPVTVILHLRVKPTPVPTRAPSYGGGSSGGGYSGGGSSGGSGGSATGHGGSSGGGDFGH